MALKNEIIYSIGSKPFGLTFEDCTINWWKWLLAIPKSISPVLDTSGQNAHVGQLDPNVFFLCQTVEGLGEQPRRKISIGRGKCVFMPILNWISNFYNDGDSEQELIETAVQRIDAVSNLQVSIDGHNIQGLTAYRFRSEFFEINMIEDNILDIPAGKTRLVSDGYWLFTKPLESDTKISTFGSCSSGITKIGVNYFIKLI